VAVRQVVVQANRFGVMQVHNLKDIMGKKGVEFERECLISIYEESDKTILATLKPTSLPAMFNAPQLEGEAQEVGDTIVKIMKGAVSG